MDRIEMIAMIDSEWAIKNLTFLEIFPEFEKYRKIISMTNKAISGNESWEPKTLFEFCIYYPCT